MPAQPKLTITVTEHEGPSTTTIVVDEGLKRLQTPWEETPSGPCEACGVREASCWWTGNASMIDVAHGRGVFAWCTRCCLEAQLTYAREQAARIPALETELAEITG